MFGALTVTGMGVLLHQTNITYDPQIVMNPVTPMSWVFYGALTVTGMGVLLHQTNITYDPQIVMNPVTPMSWVFYAGYALLCLMPMAQEIYSRARFRYDRDRAMGRLG